MMMRRTRKSSRLVTMMKMEMLSTTMKMMTMTIYQMRMKMDIMWVQEAL